MGLTSFVAASRNDFRMDAQTDRILAEIIAESGLPTKKRDNLLNPRVSGDVRHLIALHDRGGLKSFETKGQSYKVLLGLLSFLRSVLGTARPDGLMAETMAQAITFVKSVPAENIFLRFEVTNKKPQVPHYNPAHICAYDPERSYGADYLQMTRRLTIFGSTSSVMADRDMGALLERGKKKCAVLYMGTQKTDDARFLDPASQMAIDLVVTGIEQNRGDLQDIERKIEIIRLHPEIAELHAEVSKVRVLFAEFQNTLDLAAGQDIAARVKTIGEKIAQIEGAANLADILAPLRETMEGLQESDVFQSLVGIEADNDDQALSTDAALAGPDRMLTELAEGIETILADQSIPAETRLSRVLALCQDMAPELAKTPELRAATAVYLKQLESQLNDLGFITPVAQGDAVGQPRGWEMLFAAEPSQGLAGITQGVLTQEILETLGRVTGSGFADVPPILAGTREQVNAILADQSIPAETRLSRVLALCQDMAPELAKTPELRAATAVYLKQLESRLNDLGFITPVAQGDAVGQPSGREMLFAAEPSQGLVGITQGVLNQEILETHGRVDKPAMRDVPLASEGLTAKLEAVLANETQAPEQKLATILDICRIYIPDLAAAPELYTKLKAFSDAMPRAAETAYQEKEYSNAELAKHIASIGDALQKAIVLSSIRQDAILAPTPFKEKDREHSLVNQMNNVGLAPNPAPTNPVPITPAPTNPVPTNPVPITPAPTNPVPTNLVPITPAPTNPEPPDKEEERNILVCPITGKLECLCNIFDRAATADNSGQRVALGNGCSAHIESGKGDEDILVIKGAAGEEIFRGTKGQIAEEDKSLQAEQDALIEKRGGLDPGLGQATDGANVLKALFSGNGGGAPRDAPSQTPDQRNEDDLRKSKMFGQDGGGGIRSIDFDL